MKPLKSLRKGADRRAKMKNPDGTPIHYSQKDQIPVIEDHSEENNMHAAHHEGTAHDHAKMADTHEILAHEAHADGEDHQARRHQIASDLHHRAARAHTFAAKLRHLHTSDSARARASRTADEVSHRAETLSRRLKEEFIVEDRDDTPVETSMKLHAKHVNLAAAARDIGHHEVEAWHTREAALHKAHAERLKAGMKGLGEAIETLDQLYPIFEEAGLFEAHPAATAHAAGQHAAHHHQEIQMHAKAMARHMTLHKANPHDLSHTAKISDYHDNVAKKHGHEAARYTHMAAQAYAAGNERGGDATVAGAHRHSLRHHGLLPESLTPARAKEALARANYQAVLAQTAKKSGVPQAAAAHEKKQNRYQKLLIKTDNVVEAHTGPTRMDLQKTLNSSILGRKGWTLRQHLNHVEKTHKVKNIQVKHENAYGAPTFGGTITHFEHIHEEIVDEGYKIFTDFGAWKKHVTSVHKAKISKEGSVHTARASHGPSGGLVGTYNEKLKQPGWAEKESTTLGLPRHHIGEETIIEAGSSKSAMKRKYLGKSKGRTKVGTKAHPIDTDPKLVLKDNPMARATSKMPQPMASKGI